MKKTFGIIAVLILAGVLPLVSHADRVVAERVAPAAAKAAFVAVPPTENQKCDMKGDSSVSVNFNSTEKDITKIQSIMDQNIATVKDIATQSGISDIEMQSMNYSVSVNNSGSTVCVGAATERSFQFYGSANFKVTPAEKATELTAKLAEKGYNASMSINQYRQCQ